MKDYNLGLMQPGEEREVNVFGDYVRNIGEGQIKIVARNLDKSVKAFSTVLGAGGWRSPESEYNHWLVTNNSSIVIAVSVLIGKGEAGESEVQINANVNTRAANLTLDGNQFYSGYVYNSISTYFSCMAFLNPIGSGIKTYINLLKLSAFGAEMRMSIANTAELAAGGMTGSYGSVKNKQRGGADGKTDHRIGINLTAVGAEIGVIPTDSAGTPTPLDFGNSPFELSEDEALVLHPNVKNTRNAIYAEVFEQ